MSFFGVLIAIVGLAFSSYAFAESNYGIFMVVKGDVKVEKTDATTSTAKVGLKVFPGDTIKTATDSRAKITMADRNNIHISPQSVVKIAAYSHEGDNKNVELQLNEGKVRNEVNNRYDGEKSKFIIKTPSAVAGVRGTDFLVNFDIKTKVTDVVTFKGSVALSSFSEPSGMATTVILNKQQSSSVGASAPPAPVKTIPEVEFKKIENETKINPFTGVNGSPGGNSGAPIGNQISPKESREPLKDTGDKSSETFDKVPIVNSIQNRPPQPMKNVLPPPPNTRVNDAIRNKTDKTKVIIQPKIPTTTNPTNTIPPGV